MSYQISDFLSVKMSYQISEFVSVKISTVPLGTASLANMSVKMTPIRYLSI